MRKKDDSLEFRTLAVFINTLLKYIDTLLYKVAKYQNNIAKQAANLQFVNKSDCNDYLLPTRLNKKALPQRIKATSINTLSKSPPHSNP